MYFNTNISPLYSAKCHCSSTPSFCTWHLRTSSVLILLVCSRFSHPSALNANWNLNECWPGESSDIPVWVANTWLCSPLLPLCGSFFVRGKWALTEPMWWIIHKCNSCCCWNVVLAVKWELGLHWPSFYTSDTKPCNMPYWNECTHARTHTPTTGIKWCQFKKEKKSMLKFISLPSVVS